MALPTLARTPRIVLTLAAFIFLAAMWGFYSSDAAVKARERDARLAVAESSVPSEVGPTFSVDTETVKLEPGIELVELSGVLEPIRKTWVASETMGRIVEVGVAEHSRVEEGALLVRLDTALPEAELIRAKANHQLAKDELERQQRLGSQSVASQVELDRARAEERRTYAALLEARTRLGHATIEAPFPGLVNSLDFDPGAYVQPGTQVAEILDVSKIEVSVPVSDRQVGAIAVGAVAKVRIDALGNELVEGRIVRVGAAPQSQTQRFPVIVELDNPEGKLLPGMLAHVRLELGETATIRIPARAVTHEFELDYVYTLDDQDAVHRTRVSIRPVPFRPDLVEVREGLRDGDRVVTTAISRMREGLRVIAQ